MRNIIIIVVIVVITVFGVILLHKTSVLDLKNPFQTKPVKIAKTANIIEDVRQLGEFTTATFYQENVIVKKKKSFFGNDELVLIIKGKVRAGFDLSTLSAEDFSLVAKNDITIKLPQVKILDVITNPSNFIIFVDSGKWSHEEVKEAQQEARKIIEINALETGILQAAEKAAIKELTYLFQAFGFGNVIVELNAYRK